MCQTPPRVVTHQICVENPSRIAIASRSRSFDAPIRPDTHHASRTTIEARNALMPGSSSSALTAPTAATSGTRTIAGNGANGT